MSELRKPWAAERTWTSRKNKNHSSEYNKYNNKLIFFSRSQLTDPRVSSITIKMGDSVLVISRYSVLRLNPCLEVEYCRSQVYPSALAGKCLLNYKCIWIWLVRWLIAFYCFRSKSTSIYLSSVFISHNFRGTNQFGERKVGCFGERTFTVRHNLQIGGALPLVIQIPTKIANLPSPPKD